MKLRKLLNWLALCALLLGVVSGAVAASPQPAMAGAVEAPAPNAAPRQDVLYFWDFEGDDGGLSATLDWQWGTYAWVGGGCYGTSHVQPPAAYSGTDMWGTVLNTCYNDLGNNTSPCANANPNDDSILSLTIDLTGVVGDVELSWWEWYDLFGSFDWAEVRVDGDVVWQNCESHVAPTAWVQQTVDLTSYAGGPVTIEFHMMASTVVNYAGWYIDDVMVTGQRLLDAWKEAPATAENGEVISYTITIEIPELAPGLFMTDVLPVGVEYANNLTYTQGYAWYDAVDNAVYWTSDVPRSPASAAAQPGTLAGADAGPATGQVGEAVLPETASGVQPSLPVLPVGTPRPLNGGGLLYLTSLDIGNATFAVYDSATDAWTTLTPYETGCQMAVSSAGQLYAYGYNTGNIELYDPATDTWTAVMAAPPGATGQHCNLEITNAGEFLYTQFNVNTLWYTSGGVWNTQALPFTTNAMGDYDPTADQYVIGEIWTTNAHLIDVHTWAITDFASPVGNGEYARFSVVLDNRYYFEAGGSNIHSFDLSNSALPPLDHGITPGYYTSAAGDRINAVIYSASLDSLALNLFDPVTSSLTPLTGYGTSAWHSSVAFVAPLQQVMITFDVTVTGHCGDVIVNEGVARFDTLIEPFTATTVVEGEPALAVSPLLLDAGLCPDTTGVQTLSICNEGDCPLEWDLMEVPSDLVRSRAGGAAPRAPAPGTTASRGGSAGAAEPILYNSVASFSEGFDDITLLPGQGWFFQNNSEPLGLTDWFQGNDTVFPAHAGAPTAYIGANYNNTAGVGTISNWMLTPEISLKNDDTISFWTRVPTGSTYPDRLELRLSTAGPSTDVGTGALDVGDFDTLLLSVNPSLVVGGYPEVWTQFSATLSDIPPGATGRIAFRYFVTDAGPDGSNSDYIGIDTVEYVSAPAYDIPWLSEDPISGTVPWGECQDVAVTFDATGLAPGDYQAGLVVVSNDPVTPTAFVSTTLTVLEPLEPVSVTYTVDDLQVTFDATVSGTEPISFTWDFDDGNTSSEEDPVHVYAEGGCYTVTLTVENPCGTEDWSEQICVCEPVAGAGFDWSPVMPLVGETVYFSATLPLTGTAPFTFTWDFDDGFGDVGMYVNHAFAAAGTYSVTLTVENACGETWLFVPITVETGKHYLYLPIVVKD